MINETTRKCSMCAEQIPLEATVCQYCGARFEVTSKGYCQNCHLVRDADENGCCKVCNSEIIDRRVESRLIEESVQESLPVPKPTVQPAPQKTRKSLLPFGVLAGILIFAGIGAVLLVGRNNLRTASSLFATDTPTATITFTPTKTSTATVTPLPTSTRTPRPTSTATPDRRILNPANQHLYLYVKIQKQWHEARDYCASMSGHLVTIQAPSENKFVYDLVKDGNLDFGTWLGGTDEEKEGTWTWVTGEPWNYRSWKKYFGTVSEPDNKSHPTIVIPGDEIHGADYLTFDSFESTWHDDPNDEPDYFVCEWEQ